MIDRDFDEIIDIPEAGKKYEDVFSGKGHIYTCLSVNKEAWLPYKMLREGENHPTDYHNFGWRLVE